MDLEIQGGAIASAKLEELLLGTTALSEEDKTAAREALLRYCERDTLAMVRIYEKLVEIAG